MIVQLNKFINWLWFGKKEMPRAPLPINFPAGSIKMCFSEIQQPPVITIRCLNNKTIGMIMLPKESEAYGELPTPAIAMTIMGAHNAILKQVYCEEKAMLRSSIPAEVFDPTKIDIIKLPRWRMLCKCFQKSFYKNDDYDDCYDN